MRGSRIAGHLYFAWAAECFARGLGHPNHASDVLDAMRLLYERSLSARLYLNKWSTHDFKWEWEAKRAIRRDFGIEERN